MSKLKNSDIGNVFAIKINNGYGLFQCIENYEPGIDVVRILEPVLQNLDEFSPELIQSTERYFVKFTVETAHERQLILYIGKYPVPSSVVVPKKYRMLNYVPHRNVRNWYVIDAKTNSMKYVSKIDNSLLKLSCSSIWNDTLLRERLEENWSLEQWK
jgi:hypothetical protein